MNIYYSISTKHLIAVPARNGTTHLDTHSLEYNLISVRHAPIFKSIIDETIKKTFIYRDPCLRLLSYYNRFVYQPHKTKSTNNDVALTLFKPKYRGEDLLSDILFASDNIIKNYKEDVHTQPQVSYFEHSWYVQDIEDYEIISTEQYVKWLKLTFSDFTTKHISSPIDDIVITPRLFSKMQKIQDLCKVLYKDDYELLEPNISYI